MRIESNQCPICSHLYSGEDLLKNKCSNCGAKLETEATIIDKALLILSWEYGSNKWWYMSVFVLVAAGFLSRLVGVW